MFEGNVGETRIILGKNPGGGNPILRRSYRYPIGRRIAPLLSQKISTTSCSDHPRWVLGPTATESTYDMLEKKNLPRTNSFTDLTDAVKKFVRGRIFFSTPKVGAYDNMKDVNGGSSLGDRPGSTGGVNSDVCGVALHLVFLRGVNNKHVI